MAAIDFRQTPMVLLDDSRPAHRAGRSLLFHSPDFIIRADTLGHVPDALDAIDRAVEKGLHVAGWIAYECAAHFEPRLSPVMQSKAEEPLIWMMATQHAASLTSSEMAEAFHLAQRGNFHKSDLQMGASDITEGDYLAALSRIHAYIQAGDVYQINHTFPLPCALKGDALALYEQLRASQPVPFGAYIDTGTDTGFKVLSLSPELFVRRQGSRLAGKPMKGTAPRGASDKEDSAITTALRNDEKSRAENLMIVDLIRNDLSRISRPGSVKVSKLFETEKYPTLHQMTSTVEAEALAALPPSRLLSALFPCGSVTGAPKVRAMEVVAELESVPRGVYCGAIGHFSPGQNGLADWSLNVPIRTMVLNKEGVGRLSVGSGVVADSNPSGEYQECLLKARFVDTRHEDFSLIETIRLDADGSFCLLDRHLSRLKASAAYFDFAFDEAAIRGTLEEHRGVLCPLQHPRRVRLLLANTGATTISSTQLEPSPDQTAKVMVADTSTHQGDTFLRHKTTRRQHYDGAFASARKNGFDDVLFFNDRGELTEGAISNVFLVKDGSWFTPSLECGLLPGILREHLLATQVPTISECTLKIEDLLTADTIYIGNAVRGLRTAKLDRLSLPH